MQDGFGFYVVATDTLLEGNDVYRNGGYGFQVANVTCLGSSDQPLLENGAR